MNSLNIVLLFSVFMETKGDTYYVSKEDITAKDFVQGYGECQIAVPELVYSPIGMKVRVNPDIITEDVWIGYFRARTALEYVGCSKTDAYTSAYNTTADPGQCMSACGGDNIIGISKTKCFCFKNEEHIKDTRESHCDLDCEDNGPVCGGSNHGQFYMSLYRSIGFEIPELRHRGIRDTKCMYLEHRAFEWGRCTSDEMAYMCESDVDDYSDVARRFAYLKIDRGKIVLEWDKYDQKKKVLCVNVTQTESLSTTTTIKTTVKVTTPQRTPYSPSTTTVKKKTSAVTNTTSNTRTSPVTKLPSKTTTLDLSTTTKTSTTVLNQTKTDSHTNTKLESNNKTESSNIGFIVGTAASAVFVIAIVIVVVVMLLRRRGNNEKNPSHQMSVHHNNAYVMSAPGQNEQNTDSQEEYADIDMATEATGDEPESDYVHDYFILEKTSDNAYSNTKDKRVRKNGKSASNPYSNSGYEDGLYDITEGVHQKPNESGFNPYNHIGGHEEESSEYDHIGKNKSTTAGPGATDAENTYNTTNLGYLKNSTSNILGGIEEESSDYDHIGKERSGHAASKMVVDDDNTYDTTDLGSLKTSAGTSDNFYNVTGKNESDDTYSHISDRKRHQTGLKSSENDYDTFKK